MRKAIFAILAATLLLAAQNTANISGTVTDASGAAVASAVVTLTNTTTSAKRETKTNNTGQYVFELMPVGEYSIEVTAPGFKKFVRNGIVLNIDQAARIDAPLVVGAVTEQVTVEAGVPLVNTENAAIGRVTENKEIIDLPILDRNVYNLVTLTPGVDNNQTSFTLGYPQQNININGGVDGGAGSVNYYLDGGTNMDGLRNTGAIMPNPDAVQEFKLLTNSYSAEYGHFAGGVVIVATKSGGNQLHGSLFEFLRNDKMAADPWGVFTKPPLHRNEFGATIGGPLKKDKLFYFGSYAGNRWIQPQNINGLQPTAQEQAGNFSGDAASAQPKDPITKLAFPNNTIPSARFDKTAVNIINGYATTGLGFPLPNAPNNIFQGSVANPQNGDEFLAKGDYLYNSRHTISASYYQTNGNDLTQPGASTPWSIQQFTWRQHDANIGDTWTITPTTINELHFNLTRAFGGRLNLPGTPLSAFGSSFTVQGTPSLPQISISGYSTLTEAIAGPTAGSNYYELRDTLSMSRGRHTIKIGGSTYLQKYVQDTLLNNYGVFAFSSTSTATTNAWANFLLGLPTTMNQDTPITAVDDGWYYGFFVQDDFRVTPRLTITAGLRWDVQLPLVDPHDRKLTYQLGAQSTVVPKALPGELFPGDPGVGRGIAHTDYHQLGPRLGMAWDPFGDGKTSVRAAAGIFYGSISGNEWNTTSNNQPFAVRQQFTTVQSLTNPYGALPGGDPFPYSFNPTNPKFILPSSPYGVLQNFTWPYTYQLNFSIQREIAKNLSVTASYVGSLAHRLPFAQDLNYPVWSPTATTTNLPSRRPILPGTLGAILMIQSMEQAEYNAMQITVEKRLSRGITVKGFYTWSKSLEDVELDNNTTNGSAEDMNNLRLDRGRSDYDRRHVSTWSIIWTPNYFHGSNAFLKQTLNGWTVSSIVTLRSGLPFNITTGADTNADGNTTDRPQLIGNPFLDPHRSRADVANAWFNTAAFTNKFTGPDGNFGHNYLSAPGGRNVDMAIFRDFRFFERFTIQARGEMTNAFNFVNLSAPTATESSANFGKITTAGAMRVAQLGLRLTF